MQTLQTNLESIGAEVIADSFPVTAIVNHKSYKIDANGKVEMQENADRTGINVGDYINFEPDTDQDTEGNPVAKTYSKEYLSETYTGNTHNTEYLENDLVQEKLRWQVLKIYEDGSLKLIGNQTNSSIILGQQKSYNNAVWILNDICEQLYSKKSAGITARSININDFEDDDYYISETKGNWKVTKNSYINGKLETLNTKIDNESNFIQAVDVLKKTVKYKKEYSYYPKIYQYESGSGIDTENVKTDGILGSDKYFKSREELDKSPKDGVVGGIKKQANNFLKTQYTGYEIALNDANYGEIFKMLKGRFWVATRAVTCDEEYANFGIYTVKDDKMSLFRFASSYRLDTLGSYRVRPIVTLSPNVKITPSETASSEDGMPHEITSYK